MNTNINTICVELRSFEHSLKEEVAHQVKNIIPKRVEMTTPPVRPQSNGQVSNPERPWTIGGSVAIAVGIIGILSSGGTWSYILGAVGVGSVLYGQTKMKKPESAKNSQSVNTPVGVKSYEVAEKIIEISKSVEAKWRAKVEDCKGAVQRAIESSSISSDNKESLLSQTYTTERVSINFDTYVTRIESASSTTYPIILREYEGYVKNCIAKAVDEQIAIYNSISDKL